MAAIRSAEPGLLGTVTDLLRARRQGTAGRRFRSRGNGALVFLRLAGRVSGLTAALAFGAVIFAWCGAAWADSSDTATRNAGPRSTVSERSRHAPAQHTAGGAATRTAPSGRVRSGRPAPAVARSTPAPALVNLPSYWPMFTTSEQRRFDYTSPDGSLAPITSVFQYDPATKSMLYQEYDADMVWQDTWYYRARPGYGIAEWRDDYPQRNRLAEVFFGPTKKVVLATPIGWGENLPVGGVYQNRPRFSFSRSTPPQIGVGCQYVRLEAVLDEFTTRDGTTYDDVIRFVYQQKWGTGPQAGARYWMAKGVGPVAIQWVGEDPQTHQPVESVRIDAVVSTVTPFPAPPSDPR